jgi:hypothetical protein
MIWRERRQSLRVANSQNAVVMYLADLDLDGGNLGALAKRERTKCLLIIDTGSSPSLIQLGMCSELFVSNDLSPCGVIEALYA